MDKRLMTLLRNRGGQIKDGCMIDTYNQQIQYDVSCTIKTNINTANHHFVVEQCNSKETYRSLRKFLLEHNTRVLSRTTWGGISRTVKTDDSLAVMEEVKIGAMRGRNPDNLSERGKSNGNYQQHLEVNENGTSNTITSMQKDNLVVEPLNPYEDGTARTIKSQYYKNGRANFARQDGLGATGVVQIGNIYSDTESFKNRVAGRIYSAEGLSPTLRTVTGGHNEPKVVEQKQPRYRIRKLTPRECFRLMDVDENVINTIQAAGISNSQQYKLAGNSIVVACLEKIFEQMFFPQYTNSRTLFG